MGIAVVSLLAEASPIRLSCHCALHGYSGVETVGAEEVVTEKVVRHCERSRAD